MKTLIIFFSILSLNTVMAQGVEIDERLNSYVQKFSIKALSKISDTNPRLTELGHKLYASPLLSGTQNIACVHCHHPRLGTSDGLPFSIGQGGVGVGVMRKQMQAGLTKRHSTHLVNKGHPEFKKLFWDGRVGFYNDGTLWTPEPKINGTNPEHPEIARLLTTPLAAQALFPIADEVEMFGPNPNKLNNIQKWKIISDRVYADDELRTEFVDLFNVSKEDFNIGYIGVALAQFQKIKFQVTETHWDKYLRGDLSQLTLSQKSGAELFFTKAKCIACHSGDHLGGVGFQNSAAPVVHKTLNADDDLGRFDITQNLNHKQKFRIAPLRYLKYTAPYFHNGVFKTVREVVDHYNNPYDSLKYFKADILNQDYQANYNQLFFDMTEVQKQERLDKLPMYYRHHGPLGLTDEEKEQLVDFLENALI
jgi:cytochrome c peroxidase